MRGYIQCRFVVVALLSCVSSLSQAQSGKIEALPALADASVPEPVRAALEPKGFRVSLDDASVACEVWFAKSLGAQPHKDVPGVAYPELTESTFIGVLRFPQPGSDYRGQTIAPGYYSLRYELLPDDGNHLGAAPNRDFLLLLPIAADADPATALKPADAIDRSRKASGTRHPAPLSLVQPDAGTSIVKGDEGHWIFSTTLKLASGQDLPLSLVVKGQAPQ